MSNEQPRSPSAWLSSFRNAIAGERKEESVAIREILRDAGSNGMLSLILLLSLPFVFPIPVPGLSVPFGILIALLGWSLFFRKTVCIPERLLAFKTKRHFVLQIIGKGERALRILEKFTRPCMGQVLSRFKIDSWGAAAIVMGGCLLALPLPPGTNFLPAAMVVSFTAGMIARDIRLVVLGVLLIALNVAFFGGLLWFAGTAIQVYL